MRSADFKFQYEHARGLQKTPRVFERLPGVDIVVYAQVAETGRLRVRIEQTKNDEVVAIAGAPHVVSCVVQHHSYVRRGVRLFGVKRFTEAPDDRINLDGIDVAGSVTKGRRHVVS